LTWFDASLALMGMFSLSHPSTHDRSSPPIAWRSVSLITIALCAHWPLRTPFRFALCRPPIHRFRRRPQPSRVYRSSLTSSNMSLTSPPAPIGVVRPPKAPFQGCLPAIRRPTSCRCPPTSAVGLCPSTFSRTPVLRPPFVFRDRRHALVRRFRSAIDLAPLPAHPGSS
jgi:hypothetical protein